MTNFEFTKAAQVQLEKSWKALQDHFKVVRPLPQLSFDLRSKSTAGQAIGGTQIRLNLGYVKDNAQTMLERTVPHEVVHCWLVASRDPSHVRETSFAAFCSGSRRRLRRDVHGHTFQRHMALLGADTSRCHSMGKSEFARTSNKWGYKCPKCGCKYQLSTVLHNKIQRGQRRYHSPCGREATIVRDI